MSQPIICHDCDGMLNTSECRRDHYRCETCGICFMYVNRCCPDCPICIHAHYDEDTNILACSALCLFRALNQL